MNLSSPAPFELGEVLDGVDGDGNSVNDEILGKVFILKGRGTSTAGRLEKETEQVWAVALKNTSATALEPKQLAKLDEAKTEEDIFKHAAGKNDADANQLIVAVDPYLAAGAAAQNKIFWGIVRGITTVRTNATLINVAVGDEIDSYNDAEAGVDVAASAGDNCGYSLQASTTESADLKVFFRAPWFC
jgi:hypothetical protein